MRQGWMRAGRRVAGVVMLMGLLVAMPGRLEGVAAQTNPDAARALAVRLLAPPVNGPNGMMQTTDVLPGMLPGDLPLMLPQPPGATLVGSVVRKFGGMPLSWEVVFDSPSAQDDLIAYYGQQLGGQGWMAPPARTVGGRGFAPAAQVSATKGTFCRSAMGPYLAVNTLPGNDLRVVVGVDASGLCAPGAAMSGGLLDRMPALAAPAGVTIANPNGYIGPNKVTTEAVATASASAVDLEAAYAAQLTAAGWMKTGSGAGGGVAFSTWTVPGDGGFTGFLAAREIPGGNVRDLHLSISNGAAANAS